jgi:hypothetical protein
MEEILKEILKPIKDFLTRDVIFITGGSLIFSTVIYIRGWEINYEKIPLPIYIAVALFSHSVGFAVMQLFNGLRITNITTIHNPNAIDRLIYRIFARRKWVAIENPSGATWLAATPLPYDQAQKDRIITLKHIGATMGPCAFLVVFCSHLQLYSRLGAHTKSRIGQYLRRLVLRPSLYR